MKRIIFKCTHIWQAICSKIISSIVNDVSRSTHIQIASNIECVRYRTPNCVALNIKYHRDSHSSRAEHRIVCASNIENVEKRWNIIEHLSSHIEHLSSHIEHRPQQVNTHDTLSNIEKRYRTSNCSRIEHQTVRVSNIENVEQPSKFAHRTSNAHPIRTSKPSARVYGKPFVPKLFPHLSMT